MIDEGKRGFVSLSPSESSPGLQVALGVALSFDPTQTPMLSRDDLQSIALFESLNDKQLDQILDRHRDLSHQADQVIVMEQDWGESLFRFELGLLSSSLFGSQVDIPSLNQ